MVSIDNTHVYARRGVAYSSQYVCALALWHTTGECMGNKKIPGILFCMWYRILPDALADGLPGDYSSESYFRSIRGDFRFVGWLRIFISKFRVYDNSNT